MACHRSDRTRPHQQRQSLARGALGGNRFEALGGNLRRRDEEVHAAVSRDMRVHVDHAVRGCGLALLRLALHTHALRRLCAVVSRPLLAGAVAAALRRLVLGGHAAAPCLDEFT